MFVDYLDAGIIPRSVISTVDIAVSPRSYTLLLLRNWMSVASKQQRALPVDDPPKRN